ncbi:MAG: aspartate carbamoyltransferase regulatory subunit [Oscillospiraceae bacterium]|nr:aspartate carbamoyltransferase regulatory subunit [Oscillospiraceae bacterium]
MIIGQLKDGYVLDHITAGRGMEIYDLLGLGELDCSVAMIKNAESPKMGLKDIIKIGRLIDLDFSVLGYVDPGITVDIIRDGKRVEKKRLTLPERLYGVIRCRNPRCISSTEQGLAHEFRLTDRENQIYRCVYCDSLARRR